MELSVNDQLKDEIKCLYISPLRALNNDIYKNLILPIEDLYKTPELIEKRKITIGPKVSRLFFSEYCFVRIVIIQLIDNPSI